MTLQERTKKIELLRSKQYYSLSFYKKLTDNQILAIYYKVVIKKKN